MCRLIIHWSVFLLLFCFSFSCFGQAPDAGPYYFSVKRELSYGVLAAGALGTGFAINQGIDDVALAELHLPRVSDFDQTALEHFSTSAKTASDITAYTGVALPVFLLLSPRSRNDAGNLAVLLAETMVLNQGVTDIIKSSARRPRPYLYVEGEGPEGLVEAYDRTSFLSAHTSNTAAATFFLGRVFADYHPDSKLRPYVWTLSAALPAVTGYLRIRGGQHFPSDVIAGYVLGASIGYLVPTLHKRPLASKRLVIVPSAGGVYLSYSL